MRILTFVNWLTGALVLQDLVDAGHEVVGVVLFPPDQEFPVPDPKYSVRQTAWKNLLPTYTLQAEQINKGFVDVARRLEPDLAVTMHFPVIFRRQMLQVPRLGFVNMHPSKVPAGRGYAPMAWHMALGEPQIHMTLHYLNEGIDTGDIIDVASVDVAPDDTGSTAGDRLCYASAAMLKRQLPAILAGTAPRRPQGEQNASFVRRGDPWDHVEWGKPSVVVDRRIRAYARPMGGAYSYLGGQRLTIWSARTATAGECEAAVRASATSGEVVAVLEDGWLVRTGDGAMVITEAELTDSGSGVRAGGLLPGRVFLG